MAGYGLEGPKWTGATVTWSFANPSQPDSMGFTARIPAPFQASIRRAVATWDNLVSLTFKEVPDSTANVDIRFGWANFGLNTGQIGETNYSYASPQNTFLPGVKVQLQDPAQRPLAGSDPIYQGTETSLYQVAVHEFGHALGLDHSSDPAAVMYPISTLQNRDVSASDIAGINALYAPPAFAVINSATSTSTHPDGDAYVGPVSYLERELIYGGSDGMVVSAKVPNVFIHTGGGDDAIAVQSGQNVLDGGQGSNFLIGGTGNDTFFIDARGGAVTWGTLVNFHHGSSATLWGFDPVVSTRVWTANEGAAGYTGPTIHADLANTGTVSASITFANMTDADAARLQIVAGSIGGLSYLAITNPV